MGKKRKVKKGKTWAKNGLVHLHFFAFILLFRFAFFKLLFCICFAFFQAKSKINASKKMQIESKTSAKNMQMDKSIVSPFCFSLFDFPFFPVFSPLFCFCVFWILLICFFVFSIFFCMCLVFFSSLLILRISYGLVNIRLAISVQLLVLGMIKALTSTDATEERKRERGSGYAQRERERERWNDIDICPT